MASHGGTIRPVSLLASHTLETVLSHEHQIAASSKKSSELSLLHPSQTVRQRYLAGAFAVLFAMLCVSSSRLEAQSTFGSIRGTVQDSSGAAIPDTQITLHSIDENTDRTVMSDATGSYAFENVLANKYSIRARHDGFAETVVGGITLAARQDLRYTLQMKISEQATTVEVNSSAN
jgi:carboxypeptidase family protein